MMTHVEERMRSAGISLPDVMPPVVDGYTPAFEPFVRTGAQIHVSGRLAKRGGEILAGKIGTNISLEEAKAAAREVAIELLAVLRHACGDLERASIVKILVFANGAPGFTDPHRVADGASDLLIEILGAAGRHSRSAVVVADLPFGACLEIEMVAEVENA